MICYSFVTATAGLWHRLPHLVRTTERLVKHGQTMSTVLSVFSCCIMSYCKYDTVSSWEPKHAKTPSPFGVMRYHEIPSLHFDSFQDLNRVSHHLQKRSPGNHKPFNIFQCRGFRFFKPCWNEYKFKSQIQTIDHPISTGSLFRSARQNINRSSTKTRAQQLSRLWRASCRYLEMNYRTRNDGVIQRLSCL